MTAVGLSVHGGRPEAVELARTVASWLEARGHVVVPDPDDADVVDLPAAPADASVDLVVAIGGDGTVLRAARRALADGADVLGMNLGTLGYLADVEPAAWHDALSTYLDGDHRLEERMLVSGRVAGRAPLPDGLNEIVIEKQSPGRTVRLGVAIDGSHFTSYVADGLIVATPTGSTAYSLSARGPIVAPSHRALVMTPVSPHTLFDRSLILEPDSVVTVTVLGDRDAPLSVDGQDCGTLAVGEAVQITAADQPVRFVRVGARDFHQVLKAKFGLSDR